MIKKYNIFSLLVLMFVVSCVSKTGIYDDSAIKNLDKLSETIGQINACSYTLNTIFIDANGVEYTNENDVYMRGPDKMYVSIVGTNGRKGFWYDGSNFAYLSYDKNTYDMVSAPDNIISAIDRLHEKYGIDFPAADFFYPSFTDDIIENFDEVITLGDSTVRGVECTLIEAVNSNKNLKIWIDKNTNLPHRLVIVKNGDIKTKYEADFSNWRINPNLPDLLFEFEPPSNSTKVELKAKK